MWQVSYNGECVPRFSRNKAQVVTTVSEALIVRNQKRER
jgi:hypothetical protein